VDDLMRALREADPVAHEPGLSGDDADRMRRAIVAAADRQPSAAAGWPGPRMLVATIVLTVFAGVIVGTRFPRSRPQGGPQRAAAAVSTNTPASAAARRQLQFATPGGTRIIWVFDPEFNP